MKERITITSVPYNRYTLTKAASLFGNLFVIENGAHVTMVEVILDGNKENHDLNDSRNASLVQVSAGTLVIASNVILQNNYSYGTGGGINIPYMEGVSNHFFMSDNAIIQRCQARMEGGGIYAQLTNDSTFLVRDNCSLLDNVSGTRGGGPLLF